jgi:hypothetical protein
VAALVQCNSSGLAVMHLAFSGGMSPEGQQAALNVVSLLK